MPPETLAQKGMEEYNKGKYFVALEYFNKILENHRFTPEALLAELKVADCTYYLEKYAEAYVYYESFEEMHPTNEAIPYVMYQKAMCYYKRIDTIDRDISGARKAIERFHLLVKAYPESPYVQDAEAKIQSSKEFLANHEFNVARFYVRTKEPGQAVVRLKYLIAMYPGTEIVPQARTLLAELDKGE
jgi:outer membrane protein assembly factor BamD